MSTEKKPKRPEGMALVVSWQGMAYAVLWDGHEGIEDFVEGIGGERGGGCSLEYVDHAPLADGVWIGRFHLVDDGESDWGNGAREYALTFDQERLATKEEWKAHLEGEWPWEPLPAREEHDAPRSSEGDAPTEVDLVDRFIALNPHCAGNEFALADLIRQGRASTDAERGRAFIGEPGPRQAVAQPAKVPHYHCPKCDRSVPATETSRWRRGHIEGDRRTIKGFKHVGCGELVVVTMVDAS